MITDEKLPWAFRMLNGIGNIAHVERWGRLQFTKDVVCDAAVQQTGLSDFGNSYFWEGLETLLASLKMDAHLHPLGRFGIHGMIVTQLANRLRFVEHRKKQSRTMDLQPPLIITGIPRSGTTFLHRMLSVDPGLRSIPFWRLMRPLLGPGEEDRRRNQVEKALSFRQRMTPLLDRKHFVRADSAEECIWLLNQTFVSHGYWVAAPVYRYLEWYEDCERRPAYRDYRDLLGCLTEESPGRRLLLKAPTHAGSLEPLFEAIPNALVIQTHRDPVEVFGSFNSLFQSVHSAVSARVNVLKMAQANLRLLVNELELNIDGRKKYRSQIVDVNYDDLVREPLQVIRAVYSYFGLSWNEILEGKIGAYRKQYPQGKYGRHEYRVEDFGFTRRELENRFARYREQYDFGTG